MAVGVILAGGSGLRFGGHVPKQYVKLAGRSIIEYTIDEFQAAEAITRIVVICHPDYADLVWGMAHKNNWSKLNAVANAGEDRFGSTISAIKLFHDDADDLKILLHDAVRPLVSQRIIAECVTALDTVNAVDVAIPTADTIIEIDADGNVAKIPRRAFLRRGQTPQAFRLGTLRQGYLRAVEAARRDFTCDCSVVSAMLPNEKIKVVDGSTTNLKITDVNDLLLAERFIQTRSSPHVIHASAEEKAKHLDRLKDVSIVAFGGATGIGAAITTLARAHGAQVHVASRRHGAVDISDIVAVRKFLTQVSAHRPIDYIINSAATLVKKPLSQMSDEECTESIGVNITGLYNVSIEARKFLQSSKSGNPCLVNFTSSSYTRGRAFYSLYSSAKAAAVNLTQALGEEWIPDGIRVICMNPERTMTGMRTRNFGIEDPGTLLDPATVAEATLLSMISCPTGMVIDVRKH